MNAEVRENALRLLKEMDESQAKGRINMPVMPSAAAHRAGLEVGAAAYDDALWYLIDEGALTEDERFGKLVGGEPHGTTTWNITRRGRELLDG